MKKFFTLVLLLTISISGFSQDKSLCVSTEVHKVMLEHNIDYRLEFEQNQEASILEPDTGQTFTIPVVFHVIHLGESIGNGSNISEANILDAVGKMNSDFESTNDLGLDVGIRFCLAKVDPNGQATNGITRYDGSDIINYANLGISYGLSAGLNELTIKSTTGWPNTRYYNIWVVHNIVGGWGGYATYPSTNMLDGTVIRADQVNGSYDVLTHELGHGFDLRHTFQGDLGNLICPNNNNCSNNGDFICDTPPHKEDDCYSTNPCTSSGNWNYSRYNLMSYCQDGSLITPDQKTRLRKAANKFPRVLLSTSSTYVCSDEITFDAALTSINEPIQNAEIHQCGSGIIGNFTVTNLGNVPIRQFSINYTYDNDVNSKSYNTNLIPGASKDFFLPEYYLGNTEVLAQHQLSIEITNVNETLDDDLGNNMLSTNFDLLDTCTVTGIENTYLSQIKVFPSFSTDGVLKFRNLSNSFNTDIGIIDASGQLLLKSSINQNNYDLDISSLSSGIYFVTIGIGGFIECRKLLIQ